MIMGRIFETFFTTRDVGSGMGMGSVSATPSWKLTTAASSQVIALGRSCLPITLPLARTLASPTYDDQRSESALRNPLHC